MENRGSGTASEGKYLYLGSTKLQHIARPGIGECKAGREFTCDEQGILSPLDLHKGRCFSSGGVANITTRFCLARCDWSGKVVKWWSPAMRRR